MLSLTGPKMSLPFLLSAKCCLFCDFLRGHYKCYIFCQFPTNTLYFSLFAQVLSLERVPQLDITFIVGRSQITDEYLH